MANVKTSLAVASGCFEFARDPTQRLFKEVLNRRSGCP